MTFSSDDFAKIATALGVEAKQDGRTHRFSLRHEESGRRLDLEIVPHLDLPADADPNRPANLVSVYGPMAFLQLQGVTGFIASEEMGEVIFFGKQGGATSGLVVERVAGCSLYANVDEGLLSADFTALPPEIMMSSVALSATEALFNETGDSAE